MHQQPDVVSLPSAISSKALAVQEASQAALTRAFEQTFTIAGHSISPVALWSLLILSGTYVHQAAISFSVPVMMPMISQSLKLTDIQGALGAHCSLPAAASGGGRREKNCIQLYFIRGS
jgi:hypothetical protein